MNTPTAVADVENPLEFLQQAEALVNGNLADQSEELSRAQASGNSKAIADAAERLAKALKHASEMAEALAQVHKAQAAQYRGAGDYLNAKPSLARQAFERAAEHWQQAKTKAVEIGFGMAEWPGEVWDRVSKRVDQKIFQAVTRGEQAVEARKDQVRQWVGRMANAFDRVHARILAIPGQMEAGVRQLGESVVERVSRVIMPALDWKARQTHRVEQAVNQTLSLGEALLNTSRQAGHQLKEVGRGLGSQFQKSLHDAEQRRSGRKP